MGEEIIRTWYPKQRDFAKFVLRAKWKDVYRVRLGPGLDNDAQNATRNWCRENCSGHWSRSDKSEVYYFENLTDSTHFRLRWCGPDNQT